MLFFTHQFAWQLYLAIVKILPPWGDNLQHPYVRRCRVQANCKAVSSSMMWGIENWTLLCSCWGYAITGDARAVQKPVLLILYLTFAWDLISAHVGCLTKCQWLWQSENETSERLGMLCKNSPSDPENKGALSLEILKPITKLIQRASLLFPPFQGISVI